MMLVDEMPQTSKSSRWCRAAGPVRLLNARDMVIPATIRGLYYVKQAENKKGSLLSWTVLTQRPMTGALRQP